MDIQTRPVNVQDPEFLRWFDSLRSGDEVPDRAADLQRYGADRGEYDSGIAYRDPNGPVDPPEPEDPYPGPNPPRPGPSTPPNINFYAYGNAGWNTCGQAAIASMLDYLGKDPFGLPRVVRGGDGRMHWDAGAIIDALKRAGYGPDVAFGFGTTGGRIRDAMRAYGCNQAYEEHSGLFSAGWEDLWERLKYFLRVKQAPVPVLVDLGALGGPYYTAHWPIAYRINAADEVYLANCRQPVVSRRTFLHAWHCSFLPLGYNHCAVYYLRSWG